MIGRRLRWMVVGGAVTVVVRARAERAVADEARRLPQRVPAAAPLLDRLPAEVVRAAGAAVVAGRTARVGGRAGFRAARIGGRGAVSAGTAAAVAGRLAARGGVAAQQVVRRARHDLDEVRVGWLRAADDAERALRADLARLHGDESAAIDALVDRRPEQPLPLPTVPPAVAPGRRRGPAPTGPPSVGRVQRSYRAPSRPWSAPAR